MSFSQLGFPPFLSPSQEVYAAGEREGGAEGGAAVSSVLGRYGSPWAHGCSAFLPYGGAADLALIAQMGPQFDLKEGPGGAHPVHAAQAFYPYGQYPYGDPSRAKAASRETTSTLKAWLQEHQKNPYPTKGEKIMLAIITKMTLTQVSTWFANARRRLKKENKVTWGRSAEDRDGRIFSSDNEEEDTAKNGSDDEDDEEEEIDLETVDVERPEEEREARGGDSGCVEGDAGTREGSELKNFEANTRDLSEDGTRGASERPLALVKAAGGNVATDNSPTPHECQRAPQSKPKIWSLAEIATSPDTNAPHKLSSVPQYLPAPPTLSTAGHPALLPGHGIYTCQIGKLHHWTNAAFLNATSLVNMKLLGVSGPNGHLPLQARHDALLGVDPARHDARRGVDHVLSGASGTEEDSEGESSEGFSPRPDGEESNHRPNTPKSSFQLITGRSHPGTAAQRILTTTL